MGFSTQPTSTSARPPFRDSVAFRGSGRAEPNGGCQGFDLPKIWDHGMGVFHIGWQDFTHDFGIVCPMGELRNRGSTCHIPIFMINMLPFRGYNRCGSTFFRPLPDIFWPCFVSCFVPSYKTSDDPCGSADRSWIGLRDPGIGVGKEITCCYIIYII